MEYSIFVFILFGFVAQMIDGTLGMGYGVFLNTFFLTLGLSPALASACVHTSEIFTTGISGFSQFKFGNLNRRFFLRLLIPGILGGILGAYLLTELPGEEIKPFISLYLLIIGLRIRQWQQPKFCYLVGKFSRILHNHCRIDYLLRDHWSAFDSSFGKDRWIDDWRCLSSSTCRLYLQEDIYADIDDSGRIAYHRTKHKNSIS